MKNYIDATVDTRLDFYIERVVRGLEEAPKNDIMLARGALAALTALGLAGPRYNLFNFNYNFIEFFITKF